MRLLVSLFAILTIATSASAQQRTQAGPMIHSGGTVFSVDPDMATPMDRDYKIAFEVATPAPSPDQLNQSINTVARFLNM